MPRHLSESELQRLLDGTLGPAGRRRAHGHLDVCAECRTRRDESAWLHQRLTAGLGGDEIDLVGQVMASVETIPAPRPAKGRVYVAVAIAVVSLVAGFAIFIFSGGVAGWSAWLAGFARDFATLARMGGALFTALRAGGPWAIAGAIALAGLLASGLAATIAAARVLFLKPRRARVAAESAKRTES